jgi:O-antigen/teichoic acid export membrane protein
VQLVSFISIVLVSRLLDPDEIGIFSIASTFLFIVMELRTLGVTQYIVREYVLTEEKIRSAYGVIISIAWTLGIGVIIFSDDIGRFYQQPEIADILILLSVGFFLAPFSSLNSALLVKRFKFKEIFWIKLVTSVSRLLFSVILILNGYGVFALAYAAIAGSVIQLLVSLFFRQLPILTQPSVQNFGEILKFGSIVTVTNISKQLSNNVPLLTLGKVSTMANVAFLSRAVGFIAFVELILLNAIAPVILPIFSQSAKNGEEALKDTYLNAVHLVTGIALPVFLVFNLITHFMIFFFFGPEWIPSVILGEIIAFAFFLNSIHAYFNQALISIKKENILFLKEITILVIRVIGTYYAAIIFGVIGVAIVLFLISVIEFAINTVMAKLLIGYRYGEFFHKILPSIYIASVCWIYSYFPLEYFKSLNEPVFGLVFYVITLPILWLVLIITFKHGLLEYILPILNRVKLFPKGKK